MASLNQEDRSSELMTRSTFLTVTLGVFSVTHFKKLVRGRKLYSVKRSFNLYFDSLMVTSIFSDS